MESSWGGEMGAAREVGGVDSQGGFSSGIVSAEAVDASLCMACWDSLCEGCCGSVMPMRFGGGK